MSTINDKIDAAVLHFVAGKFPATNGRLAFIIGKISDVSPRPPHPFHWWCAELANRSCQRLRKKGLIRYDRKSGWLLCRAESTQEDKR